MKESEPLLRVPEERQLSAPTPRRGVKEPKFREVTVCILHPAPPFLSLAIRPPPPQFASQFAHRLLSPPPQWNEYCVVLPNGTSRPFTDAVRYTALKGYLRKRPILADGAAEYALHYGERGRGWARHFIKLSPYRIAWFEEDPDAEQKTEAQKLKLKMSRGKGVGSVQFDVYECSLFSNLDDASQFALSFNNELLLLQAGTPEDAYRWVVAIASCIFFGSPRFESLLVDCQRFFSAAPKRYDDGRLTVMETVDLLRSMDLDPTLAQVADLERELVGEGGRFGAREFSHVLRIVSERVEPARQLLRAFELFDPDGHGLVSAEHLEEAMVAAELPQTEIDWLLRSSGGGVIDYRALTASLYPHAGAGDYAAPVPRVDPAAEEAARTAEYDAWLAVGSRQYAAATGGSASDAAPSTPEPAGGIGATTSFGLNTAPKPPKRGESFEKGADFDTTTATPRTKQIAEGLTKARRRRHSPPIPLPFLPALRPPPPLPALTPAPPIPPAGPGRHAEDVRPPRRPRQLLQRRAEKVARELDAGEAAGQPGDRREPHRPPPRRRGGGGARRLHPGDGGDVRDRRLAGGRQGAGDRTPLPNLSRE